MEETMKRLDGAVEWLRPFAETKCWDYCVVWKLGDDPSRFLCLQIFPTTPNNMINCFDTLFLAWFCSPTLCKFQSSLFIAFVGLLNGWVAVVVVLVVKMTRLKRKL